MKKKLMAVIAVGLMSGVSVFAQAQNTEVPTPKNAQDWEAKHKMMEEKMAQVRADCADDVQKFCPSEQGRQRMHCLVKNKASLTTACKADVTKMEEFHKRHAKGAAPSAEMKAAPSTDMKAPPPAETY